MDAPCPRVGRLIGGCKFSGRYDAGCASDGEFRGPHAAELMEASKSRTYVHDICERCGKIVKRGGT